MSSFSYQGIPDPGENHLFMQAEGVGGWYPLLMNHIITKLVGSPFFLRTLDT